MPHHSFAEDSLLDHKPLSAKIERTALSDGSEVFDLLISDQIDGSIRIPCYSETDAVNLGYKLVKLFNVHSAQILQFD